MQKRGIILLGVLVLICFIVFAAPPPSSSLVPPPSIGETQTNNLNNIERASCTDNIKNQNESDIDCGGSCQKCATYKNCNRNLDCLSNYCNPDKRCILPTCNDGTKNGNEVGTDCGGSCVACGSNVNNQPGANTITPNQQTANTNPLQSQVRTQPTTLTNPPKTYTQEEIDNIIEMYAPKSSNIMRNLSFILNLLLFIGLIAAVIVSSGKKRAKKVQPQAEQPNIQRLKDYIEANIRQGYTPQQIYQNLAANNWPQETLNQVFNSLRRW